MSCNTCTWMHLDSDNESCGNSYCSYSALLPTDKRLNNSALIFKAFIDLDLLEWKNSLSYKKEMMDRKKTQTNPYDSLDFQKKKINCSSGFLECGRGEWSDIQLIRIKSRIYFKYSGFLFCFVFLFFVLF